VAIHVLENFSDRRTLAFDKNVDQTFDVIDCYSDGRGVLMSVIVTTRCTLSTIVPDVPRKVRNPKMSPENRKNPTAISRSSERNPQTLTPDRDRLYRQHESRSGGKKGNKEQVAMQQIAKPNASVPQL
jgi:hypothetical protein